MQIAPKNVFRYHGDGAQWNAGLGEIVYKKLGWRKAAIIMDDYSFGWTSGAGIIADFCAVGGKITKRVFPPLEHDRLRRPTSSSCRRRTRSTATSGSSAAPAPGQPEGVRAGVRQAQSEAALREPVLRVPRGNDKDVAPQLVGSYVGGFGTAPGLKTAQAKAYEARHDEVVPGAAVPDDGFVYNYYNAGVGARPTACRGSAGADGRRSSRPSMPRTIASGYEVSDKGIVKLDSQPAGDPGPVPAPDREEGDGDPDRGRRLRPERRPDVRRPVQADEPAARAGRSRPA